MAFQSTKFLSLLDLQSFCANCPTATVQAVRIRDLEKEVAVLKAENLQLKADNAQMRRLWEEYQSLLDESREKAIRETTNKPSSKGSLAEKTERMAKVRKNRREREEEDETEKQKQSKAKENSLRDISNAGDNVNAPKAARLGIRGMECRYPGMRRHSLSGIFQGSAWVVHSVKAAFPL